MLKMVNICRIYYQKTKWLFFGALYILLLLYCNSGHSCLYCINVLKHCNRSDCQIRLQRS